MKKYSVIISTVVISDSEFLRLDGALTAFAYENRGIVDKVALCELKEGRL